MSKNPDDRGKTLRELTSYQIESLIKLEKEKMKQIKQGSISYIVMKNKVSRLEEELERRKALQSQ